MSNKKLSIVIPVFNKWNFTKSCLKDLLQLPADHEVIIIDNASTDETNEQITKLSNELFNEAASGITKCGLAYKRNNENLFHSAACNQGFRMSSGDYILFLNNDVRVRSNHQNWTDKLIAACDSTNGLVGPTMGQLDKDMNFIKEANAQLTGNSYLGGWCICAHKNVWESLKVKNTDQVWNEEFPFYFNDTDLSFRARQLKIPVMYIELTDIVHFGKVSAAQINIPKLYKEGRNVFLKKWVK